MRAVRDRQALPWELELDSLADRLLHNPNLRAEVASRVGIRSVGEPSPAYKEWKHRSNELSRSQQVSQKRMVELVIERAIEISDNRKVS